MLLERLGGATLGIKRADLHLAGVIEQEFKICESRLLCDEIRR
jgi:hypothetical protein